MVIFESESTKRPVRIELSPNCSNETYLLTITPPFTIAQIQISMVDFLS